MKLVNNAIVNHKYFRHGSLIIVLFSFPIAGIATFNLVFGHGLSEQITASTIVGYGLVAGIAFLAGGFTTGIVYLLVPAVAASLVWISTAILRL